LLHNVCTLALAHTDYQRNRIAEETNA
jgi:hypothetical protein